MLVLSLWLTATAVPFGAEPNAEVQTERARTPRVTIVNTAVMRLRGITESSHLLPTLAVTTIMAIFAWKVGWRGGQLIVLASSVLLGQLSVGWSNDAHDAGVDACAQRMEKPTVAGLVSPRLLWVLALIALASASVLSWLAAGFAGGSAHVFALAMAWLYNIALSRTVWSWVPYALAFGAMPAFIYVGLLGTPPPLWTVASFATLAVSAHLANALKDLESDSSAGIDGLALRLGRRASVVVCWLLLALSTLILMVVCLTGPAPAWSAVLLAVGFAGAMVAGSRSSGTSGMFRALMGVALLDVLTLTLLPGL